MKFKFKFLFLIIIAGIAVLGFINRRTLFRYFEGLKNKGRLLYFDGKWKKIPDKYYTRRNFNGVRPFLLPSAKTVKQGRNYSVRLLKFRREGGIAAFSVYLFSFDPQFFKFRALFNNRRKSIRDFFEDSSVFVVNASFFDKRGRVQGLVKSGGLTLNPASGRKCAYFVVFKNRLSPRIDTCKNLRPKMYNIMEAVRGYPLIMRDGIVPRFIFRNKTLFRKISRRSVVAKLVNGRICFLVTDTLIAGLSLRELPVILGGLGGRAALNLDGGGSTQSIFEMGNFRVEISGKDKIPVAIEVSRR